MPAYQPRFGVGARVCTVSTEDLRAFQAAWQHLHHPLTAEQLALAGVESVVTEVSYYHGGDVLYNLRDVPGTWHEQCLMPVQEEK